MKGLTLTLPYPYLIAAAATRPDLGKSWETRDWAPPSWRGELAIHAAENLKPVGGRGGLIDLCTEPAFFRALQPFMMTIRRDSKGEEWPEFSADTLRRGVIVAVAQFRGAGVAERDMLAMPAPGFDGAWVRWPDGSRSEVVEPELSFGDYSPGRRIWRLDEIRTLAEPVRCRGAMGLWDVPADVEAEIKGQLNDTH